MSKEMIEEYVECYHDVLSEICSSASYLHDIDVNQKFDIYPYSYHIQGVAKIALEYMHDVVELKEHIMPIMFAAYYHDSIEDARMTYNDVLKIAKLHMSDEQALMATEIVYALTNEKGRNRDERANDKYYKGIRETPYAPYVKACDRLFNMRYSKEAGSSMYKKYKSELPHFLKMICDVEKSYGNMYRVPETMKEEMIYGI